MLELGEVFPEKVLRHMAVVACGHGVMSRFEPPLVPVTHDVAIHASLGIIGQVGATLGIDERKRTYSQRNA